LSGASGTIVVVDDDQVFRRSMEQFLRAAGYEARSFASAKEFLASPHPDSPTCVLVDLRMPEMSGLELQEALSRAGRRHALVFVSGHGDVKATARAMRSGAIDFIEKPYEESDLLAAIERALARDRRDREQEATRSDARRRLARLSGAEKVVCELIAEGLRTKEVAAKLGKAESTVKMQRWTAMSKLGVSTPVGVARLLELAGGHGSDSAAKDQG